MAYANWVNMTLRASAATSGANEQDDAVTLPETVQDIWVVVDKTAEANADNTLTVRLQCQVNSIWFDVGWDSILTSDAITVETENTVDVTRKANILRQYTTAATVTVLAHYKDLPSNVVRVISISVGTGVANTFSVESHFQLNKQ